MTTPDCCQQKSVAIPERCPRCHQAGRWVSQLTVERFLTASALERLELNPHRFCATRECAVVYYSDGSLFERADVRAPVFHKEPVGRRMVCYCFDVTEDQADAFAESRIRAHVRAGRCACEVRNPEGLSG